MSDKTNDPNWQQLNESSKQFLSEIETIIAGADKNKFSVGDMLSANEPHFHEGICSFCGYLCNTDVAAEIHRPMCRNVTLATNQLSMGEFMMDRGGYVLKSDPEQSQYLLRLIGIIK